MPTIYTQAQISQQQASGFQRESFTFSGQNTFSLANSPAVDADGDFILSVNLNGLEAKIGNDFSVSNNVVTWSASSSVQLGAGDSLEIFYLPL